MSHKSFVEIVCSQYESFRCIFNNSLVCMDDSSAECFHWNTKGLETILQCGALNVENFSPFLSASSKVNRIVFVLSSPLLGETLKTITMILRANAFVSCSVITSLPAKCHSESTIDEGQIFSDIENRLRICMANKNSSVHVQHIPFFTACVSTNFFLMPSFSTPFSVCNCGLIEMNSSKSEDLSLRTLTDEMQLSIKNLCCSLSFLLDLCQVKGEFYSIGFLSSILCSELEHLSQQKKKTFTSKASVIVIDRLLDLAGPLSQAYETTLDKILFTFPHLPGHTFDVAVPMNDLAACRNESVFERPLLAPGCFAHKSSSMEETALNAVLTKKPREAIIMLNRGLADLATREKIPIDLQTRLSPDVLKTRILAFKKNIQAFLRSNGFLQQALCVVQALEKTTHVDNLLAMEKALMEYLATSEEEVLNYIMQMIAEKDDMHYKMEEILTFLAFFYMLSGSTNVANESSMQATLMETFYQDENIGNFLSILFEDDPVDQNVLNTVRTLFDVFRRIGSLRKILKKYSNLFRSTNPAFPATYDSLLSQLIEDIFDTKSQDIVDLEFHSTGLKDYIKTGFSLFMNVAKPQPRDNPLIFMIVLGGVTPAEIKLIHEVNAKRKGVEIILGSTNVLTPSSVLKDIGHIVKELCKDNQDNIDEL